MLAELLGFFFQTYFTVMNCVITSGSFLRGLSRCIKTKKNVLLQLYNAYVETQDQLLLEKLENKRINKYLDEIVQEVEAKAPILKRQREEFERSQKAVASLSVKLEQAMKVSIK